MLKLLFIPTAENRYEPYLLRKGALVFYTLILVFVNILPGSFSGLVTKVSAESVNSQTLIQLTNHDRKFYGLNELKSSSQLSAAALAKANDMLTKQYWDHFGPSGETPWQFIRGAKYDYVYAGENLAKGFKSSEGVHQAWMASPTHKENILSGNYKDVGVAVVSGRLLGEDVVLVVQMFGNLTTDVQKSVVVPATPSTVQPATGENGQIKSIKIVSPQNDSVINETEVNITGTVDGGGKYSVELSEDNTRIGTAAGSSADWKYEEDKSWKEGSHKVSAAVNSGGKQLKDSVEFVVDTNPPQIFADKVTFVGASMRVELLEEKLYVALVTDGTVNLLTESSPKEYTFEIPPTLQKASRASIFAADRAGNSTELDITAVLNGHITNNTDAKNVLGITSLLSGISGKDVVNIVVATFILLLVLVEIAYYRRLGKLHERMYSVFFVGIWWVFAVYSILVGFGGSVYA